MLLRRCSFSVIPVLFHPQLESFLGLEDKLKRDVFLGRFDGVHKRCSEDS